MRRVLGLAVAAVTMFAVELLAPETATTAQPAPLVLRGAIPFENAYGRIDHFGFALKNNLFVSALHALRSSRASCSNRCKRSGSLASASGRTVDGAIDLAHPACAQLRLNFVGAESGARGQRHAWAQL